MRGSLNLPRQGNMIPKIILRNHLNTAWIQLQPLNSSSRGRIRNHAIIPLVFEILKIETKEEKW